MAAGKVVAGGPSYNNGKIAVRRFVGLCYIISMTNIYSEPGG